MILQSFTCLWHLHFWQINFAVNWYFLLEFPANPIRSWLSGESMENEITKTLWDIDGFHLLDVTHPLWKRFFFFQKDTRI